jgi:DNA-binding NarL/FixJ family response regulator
MGAPPPPNRPAILCVDDEAILLMAMRQELRRRFGDRYAIETALGADEADEAIAELEASGGHVALVICDWSMPGRRGDVFLAALRERRPGIRSILLTGQADEAELERAVLAVGASGSVQKPWRAERLAEAIAKALGL